MRADLALALLHEPELLFLDEPTLGLDVLARQRILAFIQQLNRERGVTVMVTSHDMAELEQLAGRIVMIHQGRIAFDGDFARLRRESATAAGCSSRPRAARRRRWRAPSWFSSEAGRHEYLFDAAQTRNRRAAGAGRRPDRSARRRDAPRADRRGDRRYLPGLAGGAGGMKRSRCKEARTWRPLLERVGNRGVGSRVLHHLLKMRVL